MSFPMFTSVKPPKSNDELSYLRSCIDSWRAAGFDPVAVNGPSEIKTLRRLDLPVEFANLPTDGKPRIGAILDVIRESGARFAGIINDDCQMIGLPGIAANMEIGLSGRIAIAWRTDVGGNEAPLGSRYGFDAFFFDTQCVPDDDCGFHIGEASWDHWFPIACERKGAEIETLPPLLTHRRHPLNWSWQQMEDHGRRIWTWLGNPGNATIEDIRRMAVDIPAGFHARPQTICVSGSRDTEEMLRAAGHAMLYRAELTAVQTELAAMRNATFWRMTAPLRAMVEWTRRSKAA